MNLAAMKSTKYHSAVLMTNDTFMKMESQAMLMVIRISNINLNHQNHQNRLMF